MREREFNLLGITGCLLMAMFVLALCQVSFSSNANAQSVILQQPVSGALTSNFGPRTAPRPGASTEHIGQDIASNLADFTSTGTLMYCRSESDGNGAGNRARVSHGCCVEENFFHLDSCALSGSNPTFTTDNTGRTSGPHLHWEVIVKGVWVDPMVAIGQNLCDPAVQDRVIADAYTKLPASRIGGGGGSTGDCTAPPPPQEPVDSIETVQTGEVNPVTGIINTGPPIIITRTVDGRTIINVNRSPYDPPPPLPPSVTTGFTQSSTTDNAVTGCATDTWTAMVNQSVLQTRREMMINERYITKPDSVLGYACIGQSLAIAGERIGPLFSENRHWANLDIEIFGPEPSRTSVDLGQGSLDGAIGNAAYQLAENFISSSFFHDYLGGTVGETPLPPIAGDGEGSDADFPSPQSIDNCAAMSNVWQLSKCGNVTDTNMFPTFQELIGNDIRIYPSTFRCTDIGITQEMINVAGGQNVDLSPYNTHLDILAGRETTDTPQGAETTFGGDCSPPIPTGVTVARRVGASIISLAFDYTDAICPTPGCSYQNSATFGMGTCER